MKKQLPRLGFELENSHYLDEQATATLLGPCNGNDRHIGSKRRAEKRKSAQI